MNKSLTIAAVVLLLAVAATVGVALHLNARVGDLESKLDESERRVRKQTAQLRDVRDKSKQREEELTLAEQLCREEMAEMELHQVKARGNAMHLLGSIAAECGKCSDCIDEHLQDAGIHFH